MSYEVFSNGRRRPKRKRCPGGALRGICMPHRRLKRRRLRRVVR